MNLTKTTQSLEKNGYKVSVFQTLEEADRYLNQQIDSTTVGLGGSMTIEEMGSFQTLSTHNEVYWHWHPADGLTAEDTRKKADVYKRQQLRIGWGSDRTCITETVFFADSA